MMLNEKITYSLKNYLFNLILIWPAILFYRYNHYYRNFLTTETQTTLLYLAFIYTIIGFLFYVLTPIEKTHQSTGLMIFRTLRRVFKDTKGYLKNFTENPNHPSPKIEKHEKTAILFVLVKIFFLPLMLNFFFSNYFSVKNNFPIILNAGNFPTIEKFNNLLYPFLLSFLFMIDTLYFCFGYTFESKRLKNKVRSVEPTLFGWLVAILCYPPFSEIFTNYASWYANDYSVFPTTSITFIARVLVILFLAIYVSASIALGTKCSNLTNRGIISRGPYRFVRHPAYISKNLAWWITLLPLMNFFAFVSMFAWSFVYYLRAITEERHLIKDPDYQEYCKKVKYRFIPRVY